MAWVTLANPMHNTFSSLFVQNGDSITINGNCLAILEKIFLRLVGEDSALRTFRRAIGFGQNIRRNLIPLLLYVKDDTKIADSTKIIDTIIKILVNLTIPVEYLLSVEAMSRTEVEKHTVFELNNLLTSSKEIFTDSKSTKALVDHMKFIVESHSQLDSDQCDSINNCLLLIRNILHVPENKAPASNGALGHTSMQNQIMWNLFTQNIDKIIIYLMSCPQKVYWGVTLVQLIALLYKDQHVGTLQKLLNLWLESSYSDSSDDNESNTSPPDQGSEDFSPLITSDPTSDSSDNGANDINKCNSNNINNNNTNRVITDREPMRVSQNRSKSLSSLKRNKSTETDTSSSGISSMGHSIECNDIYPDTIPEQPTQNTDLTKSPSVCQSNQSEISDCGYATQVENQESISTSSNEDDQKPVHQKPPTFQKTRYTSNKNRATTTLEKKELKRKKLVKRRKTNIITMKGLMHHLPTDEDIANILKEFTVDFLLKGYGTLVNDLYTELLSYSHVQIDTSHFLWLVTYFLKFAIQMELDPEHISSVLSQDIFNYLVFQGIWIYEELEISYMIPGIDLKPCLRRLHLVVTAIREFLQAIEAYQKMIHLCDSDKDHLAKLQYQIGKLSDLKMLFVLLIRQYNPNIQSRQYLQDLILTNHCFFLFLDNSYKTQEQHDNMMDHLKNFGTVEIMRQYGILLENFKENGEFVNNCIFTMMHHIGGDLNNVATLFQPTILKTFSQIWETDYELCDDWSDLMEYVIHKFMNTPGTHCVENSTRSVPVHLESDKISEQSPSECSSLDDILILFRWTKEEKENLIKYYNQNKESSDAIAKITEKYEQSGFKFKSQISVIQELLQQKIITENEYHELLSHHRIETIDYLPEDVNDSSKHIDEENSFSEDNLIDSDTKMIREYLNKENKGKFLCWLQNVLLEACYAKLVISKPDEFKNGNTLLEPSAYYFALLNLPIPLIPWTTEQSNILKYQPFVLLLHKLGFYLPLDTGKIFVRIPNFWTPDYMFSIAQLLGPINKDKLKFDVNKMKGADKNTIFGTKSNIPASFCDAGKFSVPEKKLTPSMCRFTPFTSQLSIAIPENDIASGHLPPPELAIVCKSDMSMDCLHYHLHDTHMDHTANLGSEVERNSNCDTASMASDLTRMCVSDEDEKVDKVILVLNSSDKHA
ncbi:unnamed protein product [Psylliodes chrysocephalus]|uniref:Timeless n=1 Tax=Psylliodes chrysocephalus TaxID=3402493 RepID=A0A9P0DCF5_9CUCU|nr:unnamed protein product [Psylliodes chrysocephala]